MTAPMPPDPLNTTDIQNSLNELTSSLQSMITNIQNMNLGGELVAQIERATGSLSNVPSTFTAQATQLKSSLESLSQSAMENSAAIKAAKLQFDIASAMGDTGAMDAQSKAIDNLLAQQATLGSAFSGMKAQVSGLVQSINAQKKAHVNLIKAMNSTATDMIAGTLAGGDENKTQVITLMMNKIIAVFSELGKIAQEGLRKATELGLSASQGVGLEFSNRLSAFTSMFTTNAANMATPAQIASAQSAAMSTFVNMQENMQLSIEGTKKLQQELQSGFGSEFQLTGESLRALSVVGATTAEGFDDFRKASGRASLSSTQFAGIVNKNSLSFLLYGNAYAKAAADAERLGISLSAVQRGQESYVTNLDGAIDTIAQLNQLGGQVDFATLTQLAEFGTPEEVAKYIQSTIPTGMLGSASVRALFGQLMPGMDAETLLKMVKTGDSLDELQKKVSEPAEAASKLSDAFGVLTKGGNILSGTFGGVLASAANLGIAFVQLATSARLAAAAKTLTPPGSPASGVASTVGSSIPGKMLGGAKFGAKAGVLAGATAAYMDYQQNKDIKQALGRGLANFIGTLIGGALGSVIPFGGTMLGAMAGAWAGNWLYDQFFTKTMADGISHAGYGNRQLVTQTGTYDLDNDDTVVAGTQLFSRGGLSLDATAIPPSGIPSPIKPMTSDTAQLMQNDVYAQSRQQRTDGTNADVTRLAAKVDQLINTLQNATTTIEVNNQAQKVSRMSLVEVRTRNEIT
jgi:hypothetical protein